MIDKTMVVVKWTDSTASAQWLDDDECHELAELTSVGWLVGEKEDSLSISTTSYDEGWLGAVTIPKVAITSVRRVDGLELTAVPIDGEKESVSNGESYD